MCFYCSLIPSKCSFIIFIISTIKLRRLLDSISPSSDVDGRIILRGIFRKWEGIVGTGWSGLRIGTGGGHL
jgi:hypothetical protein